MSRVLFIAALSAMGLFSFASVIQAADAPANNPRNPNAVSNPANNVNENTAIHTTNPNAHEANSGVHPWRASETIGLKVENPQGQNLGKIEDLVFNPHNGHIRYAVLSFGGFLGAGEKWFAIPWNHFRIETKKANTNNESFVMVLDVDKNKLKNAPGFDSKQWPDFGSSAYGTSVDQFYGNNSTAAHHAPTTNTK